MAVMAPANKHRYILGKDLSHRKGILLSLTLGPTDTLLLLGELAVLVLFAPLLASRRPDERRGDKFCGWKKRNALNITKKEYRPWAGQLVKMRLYLDWQIRLRLRRRLRRYESV